jgi:integrase
MPKVVKRTASPYYYARFQINGKDHWVSTKQTERKKAQKALASLLAQARNEVSIEEQVKSLVETISTLPNEAQAAKRQEVIRAILRAQDKKISLAESWKSWLSNPNKEYDPKPKTLLGYEAIWKRFKSWAVDKNIGFLHEVTASHAENYAADLWKSNVSASTYNQHIKFMRAMFSALELEAGLITNSWTRIGSNKKSLQGGRRNLTLDELQSVLAKAEGNMKHLLIIGVFTGLRLADVVNLKVENIDNNPYPPDTGARSGFIVVKPRKTERVNKIIEIPLHPVVAKILRDLKAERKTGFLFPDEQALHEKDAGGLSKSIQALFESCNIRTTEEVGQGHRRRAIVRVGFHSLRHTFVTLCAKAGAPLHVVQKLVGHGSPMLTSDKYLHLDKADKQAAIKSLPTLDFDENGEPHISSSETTPRPASIPDPQAKPVTIQLNPQGNNGSHNQSGN